MADIFLKIVNMSISACWIVLAILLFRFVLKKAPKWINCVLWGIAGLRLIMPFSFESILSLIPSAEFVPQELIHSNSSVNVSVTEIFNYIGNNPVSYDLGISNGSLVFTEITAPDGNYVNPLLIITSIASIVWIIGIAALLIYTIISFIRLKSKIGTAVLLRDNIYQSESVVSPFVLGIIKPKIYLPFNMNAQDMDHVIAHEQAHIRRKDYLWKPLGFLILTLHWFNPMVWLGYILLCRDIELACDEKVVKELNNEQRADYSEALLSCSVNRRMIAACPLAFGEVGVKDRIKSVLNYKKPAFWIIVVAIVVSITVAVCFLTNPISDRLANIEGGKLDAYLTEQTAVMVSDGKTHKYVGAVKDDMLKQLFDIIISRKEVSLSRDEERDKTNTLILNMLTEKSDMLTSFVGGIYIHFNSDFSQVWVNDGVKPTFSYKVKNPESAKEIYNSIINLYLSDAGGADSMLDVAFESTLSYAGIPQKSNQIFYRSLNREKLSDSSVRHLPIHRLDTYEDLTNFKNTFSGDLTFDNGYDEIPSFNTATTKYDKEFFEDNSLIVVFIDSTNSTHRYAMQSVEHNGVFCVQIEETTKAKAVDDALSGWFLTVTASDELLDGCTEFDAYLNDKTDLYDGSKIPQLTVLCNDVWAETVMGTTEWTFDNGDGTMQTINGDSVAHPTDRLDYLLPKALKVKRTDSELTPVTMVFDTKPDKIEVNSWFIAKNGSIKPFDTEKKGMDIFLNSSKETCVYEVVATWNSSDKYYGTVRYSFCVAEQEEKNEKTALTPNVSIPSFSYAKDSGIYVKDGPGVKTFGFVNTSEIELSFDNVVELAKNERTVKYDTTKVYFDSSSNMWKVVFYDEDVLGGDQTVYIDGRGITALIVYGE